MKTGGAVVGLLFALAMIAAAGPALDRAGNENPVSRGGNMPEVKDNDFVFIYSSRGGVTIAKDMRMWELSLTVDSKSGLAVLELNRNHGDDAGLAIGRFEMPVGRDTLERLRAQLESASFTGLEAEGKYEMLNESLLTFTHKTARKTIAKIVGSGERGVLKLLGPLMEEVHKLQFALRSHPKAALQLEVRHIVRTGNEYYELDFINRGREPLYLMDPRARNDKGEWTGIRVAVYQEEQRGAIPGPPSWEKIPLLREQQVEAGNAYVRIDPNTKFSMRSRPWKPERCGAVYGAQGVMINYQGVGNKDGTPVIRGGLFSGMISVVSCKDGETVMSRR